MRRRFVSIVFSAIFFIGALTLLFDSQLVKAYDSWIWVKNAVTGAYGEAVVGTGDAIYIARKTSFYLYNPADNSFVALVAPPNPDSGDAFKTGTALAWDFSDYIYALYGAATDDSRRWFYRYSISHNSWEALANTTADQGEGDAITWVGIDDCIYATIGGEQRPTYLMRYDPSTDTWSDEPSDPPAGMGDGASLVWTGGDSLYLLRGEFDENSPLWDFWQYSLSGNVWTEMTDIPADAHSGGVGGVGDGGSLLYVGLWLSNQTDYVYALSGNQAYPESPVIPDNRTYRYTISLNSWERLADLPFGVGYYVGCRLGYADGRIYAWQGAPSSWEGSGDDLAYHVFQASEEQNNSTPQVIINEVELNPSGNDNYLSVEEWVELYNPTMGDVDISGWKILTTQGITVTITIPQDTMIPAHGYYVYGRGSQWLDNNDELIVLEDSEDTEVDRTPVMSDNDNDYRSWQRYPNGQDSWHFRPSTKGSTNGGEPPPEQPPIISILSPENRTYSTTSIPLSFTISETTSWIGYSLDGQANATITGNITLSDLFDGLHYVIVYANDTIGNMGMSNTVYFTIDTTPPNITDVSQTPLTNSVLPEDVVKVNATVTDYLSGVKQITLNYTYTNSSGTWTSVVNMTNLEGNVWNATIPAFPYCTNVTYVITAEDYVNNTITTLEMEYEYQYHVIPEFSSFLVLSLFMIVTLLAAIVYSKKEKQIARASEAS